VNDVREEAFAKVLQECLQAGVDGANIEAGAWRFVRIASTKSSDIVVVVIPDAHLPR